MPRIGSKNVNLTFTAGQLTHFGGVYLLHQFLQRLRIRTLLSRRLYINERNNHFSITERLFAMLYPMILGLNTIELSILLGNNGVFQYLTGLPRVPRPNTLRRFLIQKADVLLPRMRTAHNTLRSHFIVLPKARSSYWLDCDSTVKTLYGNQEGATKGYNPTHRGRKSYHPLVCTEAHFQDCLGGELRYGEAHGAQGIAGMLDSILLLIPSNTRSIRLRADVGFYGKDFIAKLSKKGIKFVIVARMTKRLKEKVASLRYSKVKEHISTSDFIYQPQGWKKEYRFVVLREKLTEERSEQLKLFTLDKYAYHAVVTNLTTTPYRLFCFYEDHAAVERIIRTLKEDYPFSTAPTKCFSANALYTELSLLAYNIIVWFRRLCLPESWQRYGVGTLRHRLLLVPGIFSRTGNRPELKLPKNNLYQDVFEYAQERIKNLDSLVD